MKNHPYFTQSRKKSEYEGRQYISNMKDGAVAGFKYFEMNEANNIAVEVSGKGVGKMQISEDPQFKRINAEISLDTLNGKVQIYSNKIQIGTGKKALFFKYIGVGTLDFLSFELKKEI